MRFAFILPVLVLVHAAVVAGERNDGPHVESWPNGKRKVRATYQAGKLEGAFESWHENGRRHVSARYRNGLLHGRYTARRSDGETRVTAEYRDGALHGDRRFFDGKRVVSEQRWEKGRLARLDGIEPFPRPLEEIRKTLLEIRESGLRPREKAQADREQGLRVLKSYRYLVGVPWRNLRLDDDLNRRALAGVMLLEKIGRLTHTPPNPGIHEADYLYAYSGTKNSNLSDRANPRGMVHGLMDDSDPVNLKHVGHRSYCVNPLMDKTGFAQAPKGFSAMWATDRSGRGGCDYDLLTYPPRGHVPMAYFGGRQAFSIWPKTFRPSVDPKTLKASIYLLDDDYVRAREPMPLDCHHVGEKPRGAGEVLIFRPKNLPWAPGKKVWVEIEGLDPKMPFRYLVEFVK